MSHKPIALPSFALLTLGGLLLSMPAAQAQTSIISFHFAGNADSPQFVNANLNAGVVSVKNFNNDNGGNSGAVSKGITFSDASPSPLTLSYNSYDAQDNNLAAMSSYSSNGNLQLLNSFIESGPPAAAQANATVTVSSVPFTTYDLYVYAFNESSALGTFTVTPAGSAVGVSQNAELESTFDPNNPFTMATATTPGDYLLFTGLTGSSFTLTADRQAGDTSSTTFVPIDGFQLVATPAAVPEASTTISFGLLLALGLGGFAVARKKAAAASSVTAS